MMMNAQRFSIAYASKVSPPTVPLSGFRHISTILYSARTPCVEERVNFKESSRKKNQSKDKYSLKQKKLGCNIKERRKREKRRKRGEGG